MIEEEVISVFLYFNKKRKNMDLDFKPIQPVLQSIAEKSKGDFGLVFDQIKNFIDSFSYVVDHNLSSEKNTELELQHNKKQRNLRSKFNSIAFRVAVRNRADNYARALLQEIKFQERVNDYDLLSMLMMAPNDPNAMEGFKTCIAKLDHKDQFFREIPENFASDVIKVFDENEVTFKFHLKMMIPLLSNANAKMTNQDFQKLVLIFAKQEQYELLERVLARVSQYNLVKLSQETKMFTMKIISQCQNETVKENLLMGINSLNTEDGKGQELSSQAIKNQLLKQSQRRIKRISETLAGAKDFSELEKLFEKDEKFLLMKKIMESRPLLNFPKLRMPNPKKRVKKDQRPEKDDRNLFQVFLEKTLEGQDDFDDVMPTQAEVEREAFKKEINKKTKKKERKFGEKKSTKIKPDSKLEE